MREWSLNLERLKLKNDDLIEIYKKLKNRYIFLLPLSRTIKCLGALL